MRPCSGSCLHLALVRDRANRRVFLRALSGSQLGASALLRHRARGHGDHRRGRLQARANDEQERPEALGLSGALFMITAITETEIAYLFVGAGLLVMLIEAPPVPLSALEESHPARSATASFSVLPH